MAKKVAKTNAQHQAAFRARTRTRKDWVKQTLEDHIEDIRVYVVPTDYGTIKITWDWSADTEELFAAYAASQLIDIDTLLEDVNQEVMARRVAMGKRGA